MTRGRPWMRMKIAASLDGKTALTNGVSQWITGRGRAPRRPSLARARVRGADRHRHGQGRRSAAHRARGRNHRASRCASWSTAGCEFRRRRRCWMAAAVLIAAATQRRGQERARLQAKGAEVVVLPNADRQGRSAATDARTGAARHQRGARRGRHQAESRCCVQAWSTNCWCTWPRISRRRRARHVRPGRIDAMNQRLELEHPRDAPGRAGLAHPGADSESS